MAEYTIPKPYRDFYVTNPYIELKESNERLQRIVQSGYVATDSFEGVNNQVITFDKEKHGFSLTNDSSKASSWTIDLSDSSSWIQGSVVNDTGELISMASRIRTNIKIPVMVGHTYSFKSENTTTYQAWIVGFDKNDKKLNGFTFEYKTLPRTVTIPESTDYIRIVIRNADATAFTVEDFLSVAGKLSFSVSTYTAPSDVTVKVAENVAGIPTTADGWEQGGIDVNTGSTYSTEYRIRTKDFFEVESNQQYTIYLNYSSTSNTYKVYVFQYQDDSVFINCLNSTPSVSPYTFKTNESATKLKFVIVTADGTIVSPSTVFSEMKGIYITKEKMIVSENDTRIVTMPAFTSLYIESNVPYHGHALDLAE